jgi:hypothetical protein
MDQQPQKGLLKVAEEALTVPKEGTPLRPFITAARLSAQSFITETNNSVQSVAETVNKEITPKMESIPNGFGNAMSGARIRPDFKFAAVVGVTALLSSKFGMRPLIRNSTIASIFSGITFFPDSMTRGWSHLQENISNSINK